MFRHWNSFNVDEERERAEKQLADLRDKWVANDTASWCNPWSCNTSLTFQVAEIRLFLRVHGMFCSSYCSSPAPDVVYLVLLGFVLLVSLLIASFVSDRVAGGENGAGGGAGGGGVSGGGAFGSGGGGGLGVGVGGRTADAAEERDPRQRGAAAQVAAPLGQEERLGHAHRTGQGRHHRFL